MWILCGTLWRNVDVLWMLCGTLWRNVDVMWNIVEDSGFLWSNMDVRIKTQILSRIAQTTAALSRLKIIWRNKNISFASKVKLMRTLILSTFLYACESWTLTAKIERRVQALEMRCYRRLLNISYKDHVTNEEVRNRIQNAIGVHDGLLTMVKKRKLRWYGHISRSSGMAKTILQGTVKEARTRGRQKKRLEDNIKEWTGMWFGDSLRQRKTGKDGKILLQRHLWCPDDLQG